MVQEDLLAAKKLQPKDGKIKAALSEAIDGQWHHDRRKKLWTPSEEEKRAEGAKAERDIMLRLGAADGVCQQKYGAKWTDMEPGEKRKLVLDTAVQMELERTAPTSVLRTPQSIQDELHYKKPVPKRAMGLNNNQDTADPETEEQAKPAGPDSWASFWEVTDTAVI